MKCAWDISREYRSVRLTGNPDSRQWSVAVVVSGETRSHIGEFSSQKEADAMSCLLAMGQANIELRSCSTTDREKMLDMIERGASDPEVLRFSTLASLNKEHLYRVWAFIESFRAEGELRRNADAFSD